MANVEENNAGFIAERYGVDASRAAVVAAGVRPDPELSVGYANNQDWSISMGYAVDISIGYLVELGGKRALRIKAAVSGSEMAAALADDYLRNLRADASLAWVDAIRSDKACGIRRSSYLRMAELASADSIRFLSGAISETDFRQSRLEAANMLVEVYKAEGERRDAVERLLLFEGGTVAPDSLDGDIIYVRRHFSLDSLVGAALAGRADIRAAVKEGEVSADNLRLARAGRMADIGLSVGGVYSSRALNDIAPAPAFTGITAGITIPLRLSNRNRGAIDAARAAALRSLAATDAVRAGVRSDVTRACNRYDVACKQVEGFEAGILDEAIAILDSKTYSYARGETAVLDLLNARRSCNEALINYNETVYNYAVALIELGRACGF
jgi:cobalt-zinc-cadmium efflux system outer membrane protein